MSSGTAKANVLDFESVSLLVDCSFSGVGKLKIAPTGVAWKESGGSVVTIPSESFDSLTWHRVAQDHALQIVTKDSRSYDFENLPRTSYDEIHHFSSMNFPVELRQQQSSLKGWNWGQATITDRSMQLVTGEDRIAFEVPISQITNANVTAKNEVAIEVALPKDAPSLRLDSLVEIRLFIPPTSKHTADADGEELPAGDTETEDEAQLFCSSLKAKTFTADSAAMQALVSFPELPCITPRGRFEVEVAQSQLRLRGKTHDYKLPFASITRIFSLPKTDQVHQYVVVAVDPPLRQGQTRYPYICFQFPRDDEMEVELTASDDLLRQSFNGRLQRSYSGAAHSVVSQVLVAVSGNSLITSTGGGIKCSVKANEGSLYLLERYVFFLPKPCILIPFVEVTGAVFGRVEGSTGKTFDLLLRCSRRDGTVYEHSFANINKQELEAIQESLQSHSIRIRNEVGEGGLESVQSTLMEDDDESDEDYNATEDDDEEYSEDEDEESGGESGEEENSSAEE